MCVRCKFTDSLIKRTIKIMIPDCFRVKLVFILIISTLYTPSVSRRQFKEALPPNHKHFAHLRSVPPPRSLANIYTNNLKHRLATASNGPQPFSKRFLSSETKESMGGVSVASNSFVHDNYISQQFKWSNR